MYQVCILYVFILQTINTGGFHRSRSDNNVDGCPPINLDQSWG